MRGDRLCRKVRESMQGSYIRTGSGSDRVLAIENFIGETRSYADLDPVATAPGSDAAGSPRSFVQTRTRPIVASRN